MHINAYGKITLKLRVTGKRENGYHEIEQIMAPILLYDILEISKTEKDIIFYCDKPDLIPKDNLCYKVAKKLRDEFHISSGIKMNLYKHIPSEAGLGGGSADCATVLRAINYLYDLKLSKLDMLKIGIQLGADVPYCLYSELSYVSGIGEHIITLNNFLDCNVLIVKPEKGVSTKKCFELFDEECSGISNWQLYGSWREGQEVRQKELTLQNDLERLAIKLVKEIDMIKRELKEIGFKYVMMSGSGSCVFGISNDIHKIRNGERIMKSKYPFVYVTRAVRRVSDFDKNHLELLKYEEKYK